MDLIDLKFIRHFFGLFHRDLMGELFGLVNLEMVSLKVLEGLLLFEHPFLTDLAIYLLVKTLLIAILSVIEG